MSVAPSTPILDRMMAEAGTLLVGRGYADAMPLAPGSLGQYPRRNASAVGGIEWAFPRDSMNSFRHAGGNSQTLYNIAGQTTNGTLVTFSLTNGAILAMPFVAPARGGTLDRIGTRITTGAGGGLVRMAIYDSISDSNVYPNELLVDTGDITADAAATVDVTISQALTPGQMYWLCINANSSSIVIRGLPRSVRPIGHPDTGGSTESTIGWLAAFAFAAFPDPFPTTSVIDMSGSAPALTYRFSA